MKKLLLSALTGVAMMMTLSNLSAQNPSSSGSMGVSGTIDPTISLTFASDASGLALSAGNNTNAATLAFGHISAYGYSAPSGVTQTVNGTAGSATAFAVATPFDVLVMEANSSSTNYTLTAELNSADTTNTWTIDGTTVTSGSPASITASGTYDSAGSHTLKVSIPFTNTSGSINKAINFVATAN